ncbi:hypothetical protein KQX54_011249 [Cotesia glomerata]|uniref:Uncharacterized protein n=1 Tax=Cotesia glomerata TaxID=32391 RepID=A0AAV7IPE2_COTGL|nr:hypothetical protein KQX54_011249 [Cotesia glomerata]
MIKFLGILLVVGSVLEDWETDARMTVKFHHRYYEQFKELDCNGTFDENEFLRLELTCSDCGLWLKDYRSTDDCRTCSIIGTLTDGTCSIIGTLVDGTCSIIGT